MKIAVDAMGGDHAPAEMIRGVRQVLEADPKLTILLAGPPEALQAHLPHPLPPNIEILPCEQVVEMHEHPVEAVRRKPKSSIAGAVGALRDGRADAFFSAGNTGAVVAYSTLGLRLLPGVRRAGIAVPLPTVQGNCTLIDAGANITCKPLHLLQYGIMASVYAEHVHGVPNPRVGLLNIGHEDSKGNDLVRETLSLFQNAPIRFVGNIEGPSLFQGLCDVGVCEGFAGNLILKACEGLAEAMLSILHSEFQVTEGGETEIIDVLRRVRARVDYAEYGGAPLLGVQGVVLIGHGRSCAPAVAKGIEAAARCARHHITDEIVRRIAACPAQAEAKGPS